MSIIILNYSCMCMAWSYNYVCMTQFKFYFLSGALVKKLASVLGLKSTGSKNEPGSTLVDPNYVLTYDNVVKIFAIVLCFRYGILLKICLIIFMCLSQMQNTCHNNGRNWMWKNTTP